MRGTEGKYLLPLPRNRTWGCQKRAQSSVIRHTYFSRLFWLRIYTFLEERGLWHTLLREETCQSTALASILCLVKGALSVCHILR